MPATDATASAKRAGLGQAFWMIWTASTISNLGSGMTYVALPLLAASYTRDPRLVAVVSIGAYLPPLLFGLHSGALVDRRDRRRIMWSTDVVRACVVGLLCLLVLGEHSNIWVLAGLAFVLAGAEILFANAASSIVPMLVERASLERANAWLMVAQSIGGDFVGLPIGGVLFAIAAALPFGVDAATYVAAIVLVLLVPGSFRAYRDPEHKTTMWADVREGAVWLGRHRLLRTLAALLAFVNTTFAAVLAPLVLYVDDEIGAGRFGYPLLLVAFAVGAVLGSIVAGWLRQRFGVSAVIAGSVTLMVVSLAVPGLSAMIGAVAPALVVAGLASGVWNNVTISLRQRVVPEHLLGRVTSAYRIVGLGVMPLGAAVGGFVAHAYGLRAPWLVAAIVLAVASAVAIPILRAVDLTEAESPAARPTT